MVVRDEVGTAGGYETELASTIHTYGGEICIPCRDG